MSEESALATVEAKSAPARPSFGCAIPENTQHAAAQLELFARRCLDLADAVAENRMAFLDAIDMAYSAAEWCGLVDDLGDDIVQATMAAAFANAKRST
jgi:hypothetical protein